MQLCVAHPMPSPYITDQELLKLVTSARLPADVAVRLAAQLALAGTPGAKDGTGQNGAAGGNGGSGLSILFVP